MADSPIPPVPASRTVTRRKTPISAVWIIPIVTAIAGGWVAVTRILAEGPKVTIVFESAEGLEAGKTKIHYNGVAVGTLTAIRLSGDHQNVITTADMAPDTEDLLVEGTNFWVVSPRISGANITGLGTLLSGSYIGMEIGQSKQRKREFVALATQPVVLGGSAGRFFELTTPELGSLGPGTPLYFRRLEVGEVASYALDPDGRAFTVKVFVKAPYDQYVTPETRFWQASGIDVSLSASGLSVQTESLMSILVGGIAFETAATGPVRPAADEGTRFALHDSRTDAFKAPARDPQTYRLVFKGSVRGLAAGAPVEFQGIPVGEVVDVSAQVDVEAFEFSVPVTIEVDPQRFGVKLVDVPPGQDLAEIHRSFVDNLVAHGVRAQLRSGNLLTGALYVALDVFPGAPKVTLDWSQTPVVLPTQPGDLAGIESKVADIAKKIDEIDFKGIGDDLKKAMVELDRTLVSARDTLDSADALIKPGSVFDAELGSTLEEVNRAARGLRGLVDYLERHPESLIRGKKGDAK